MEFIVINRSFGRDSKNLVNEINLKSFQGAMSALETFYYSFLTINKIWVPHDLIQLNNPLGGIIREIDNISNLYYKIFTSEANVWVEFYDIISYRFNECVVFAGREKGLFSSDENIIELNLRTTRFFAYINGSWGQVHHHGSIDDPELLKKYQAAIK